MAENVAEYLGKEHDLRMHERMFCLFVLVYSNEMENPWIMCASKSQATA